jgi:SAM-dependent methyltransferase
MTHRLTSVAHEWLASQSLEGGLAIDATAGNGHDTLFLANRVGPWGRVLAFDRQPAALGQAVRRLDRAGIGNRVCWIVDDHAQLLNWVPAHWHQRLAVAIFNLGWLPGSDHRLITTPATTVAALAACCRLLRPRGRISLIAYPRHEGGAAESQAVATWLHSLPASHFLTTCHPTPNHGPIWWQITRLPTTPSHATVRK